MWFKSDSSVRGGISFDDIKSAKIDIKSLEEQKNIVEKYNTIVKSIDNLNKQNDKLYIFINKIFDNTVSQCKDIQKKSIDDISKQVVCGGTPSTDEDKYWGGEIPFLTIPDMHNKIFQMDTDRKITELGLQSKKTKVIPENSICVSCIASAGLTVLTTEKCITNQQINSIVCKDDISYYYVFVAMKNMKQKIISEGSGGTIATNLNTSDFKKLSILMPNKDDLDIFDKKVSPLFMKIKDNQRKIELLNKLYRYMLLSIGFELGGVS